MDSPAATTVLLVDDQPEVAEVTRLHLEREGEFEVRVEHDAGDALAALGLDVDCVVSDYEMPGRDGLDFLRDVREYDDDLPFILFTGRGSEEIASEAISRGVTDYLQKASGTDQYAVLANRVENAVARYRSEAAAAETETRYHKLIESLPHAVLVHQGGEVLYANDRLATLLDAPDPSAIEGRPPLEFVHPDDREAVARRIRRIVEKRHDLDWAQFRVVTLDEGVRWVETRGAPVVYEGQHASQVVLRDVTERRRRERRLEALHEAARALQTATDREAVATIAVETLEGVLSEPITAVWAHEDGVLVPLAASARAMELAREGGSPEGVVTLAADTVEMTVFEDGDPRVVQAYDEREDGVTDALSTVFFVPLDDHGLLGVASQEPRTFTDTERDLVGVLARSVVAALDRLAA